jgi:hypothetical protein
MTSDEAADDEGVHGVLHRHRIKPVIRTRAFWREEPERPLPGGGAPRHVAHDEAETVYCYDTICDPPVRHRMARAGSEKAHGTIKYRCPARHEGRACTGRATCDAGRSYGLQVWVPCGSGLRRFPPIPRATRRFERLDRGRTALERVDARPKSFWGADHGNVVGARRFQALVGAVMVVHLLLATLLARASRWEGTLGRTRLGPVAEALREPPSA